MSFFATRTREGSVTDDPPDRALREERVVTYAWICRVACRVGPLV